MNLKYETKRLMIRPIQICDAGFMLELMNTEGWLKFIGDRNVHTIEDAKLYIQKFIANPSFHYHIIELKKETCSIGVLSFLYRSEYQFPDLGFALLPNYEKLGFAFEATNEYLKILKISSNLSNVIAIANDSNKRSLLLLEKLGFSYSDKSNIDSILIYKLDLKL